MNIKPLNTARCFLLVGILLVSLTGAYGQTAEVKIKNTTKEIQPGLYECRVYLEISDELAAKIDDVTYSLPAGYPQRKQTVKKSRQGVKEYFSSDPIVTAEEIIINIKIDYDDADDVYLSYKITPFNTVLK